MTKTPDLSKLVGTKIVRVPMPPIGSPLRASIIRGLKSGRATRIRKLERSFGDEIIVVREDGVFRLVRRRNFSRFIQRCLRAVMRHKTSRGE